MLITIEGIDGAGKTTVINNLQNITNCIYTREPYRMLVHKTNYSPLAKVFLFMADHYDHIQNVINPGMNESMDIICDRYIDSRIAYGAVMLQGLVEDPFNWIAKLHVCSPMPDLTILLTIPVEEAIKRRPNESYEFLDKVQQNYLKLVDYHRASNRFVVIDGMQTIELICNIVMNKIKQRQQVLA